jgi:dihydrodipicolinate synthase/N-acetylneuraminate lyase
VCAAGTSGLGIRLEEVHNVNTTAVTLREIAASVWAVPPLARRDDLSFNPAENTKLVRHLEAGGITNILYGGNAVFHHIPLSEYAATLDSVAESAGAGTWIIPSAGPDYGRMYDQAAMLRGMRFRAVMIMPEHGATTGQGVMTGLRRFADRAQCQIIPYLKSEKYLSPTQAAALLADGTACAIKYGVSRPISHEAGRQQPLDPFLQDLVAATDPRRVLSGLGERPAVEHMRRYGVAGFTSGSVCLAPRASQALLRALQAGETSRADSVWAAFLPLEDLRDAYGAAPVLHDAVTWSGIADMGPILPLLSNVDVQHREAITRAVRALREFERTLAAQAGGTAVAR